MRAFLWGLFLLTILTIGHIWPKQEAYWLVVVPNSASADQSFHLINGTSSSIVDIVDTNTIIINPSANITPLDLYAKGALLVINASAGFGCSPPTKNKWAKT